MKRHFNPALPGYDVRICLGAGKTNYTGVLSKAALTKARNHWLLPLRELVGGVSLGLVMEDNEISADMTLAIDSLQSVIYRCIELNEEALARL